MKKSTRLLVLCFLVSIITPLSSCYLVGTQATGAGMYVTGFAVNDRFNAHYIRFPSSVGTSV